MSNVSSTHDLQSDAEIERNAYNAAFYALGLHWHWDVDTYHELELIQDARERLKAYLEKYQPHLLAAYDVDFLVNAIETKKAHCRETMTSSGSDTSSYCNWAEACRDDLGA